MKIIWLLSVVLISLFSLHLTEEKENEPTEIHKAEQSYSYGPDVAFDLLELPHTFDYAFFQAFDRDSTKHLVPTALIEGEDSLNALIAYYPVGRLEYDGENTLYLMICTTDPNKPKDLVYMSADAYIWSEDHFSFVSEVAKYHAYSQVSERHFGTLDTNLQMRQHQEHKYVYDGEHVVFHNMDTLFNIAPAMTSNGER